MAVTVATPFLELTNAVVRRQGRDILSIDHFTLQQGESIALIGTNGAGKSTFIILITREYLPLYRDIPPVLYKGNPRATLAETKRDLGVVSSSMQDQIDVHLLVEDIVCGGFYGSLGIPWHIEARPEHREAARHALEQMGIGNLAERFADTLSTGQARRVLMARALIHDPEVLVFDEPTTGLDPEGMYYVRHAMRDLVLNGKSVVMVTHYPEDIIPEIGRVVAIKDARIFSDGPKERILTSEHMTRLFDVPLKILAQDGYYSLVTAY
jgi:iron complex transport system ATP-binding protein